MNTLKNEILKWADNRGLLKEENKYAQTLKLQEEVGELCKSILENNKDTQEDSIGDIVVVLTILSNQLGFDIDNCLETAYNEIKNRKGKTINGTFIKEIK